ncbi:hypothetical protein KCQ71_22205 [Ruania sp. N2-46]|uniref:Uncharacterized protein n=1 Tax=Occultella gossypii TaxID=2800820 RepID=A0ABS7SF66_9MICO|nr:hypothetical protein [Occultella gossypii]MBZ2198877.1 hypothetical protein [Occultella gossypii]
MPLQELEHRRPDPVRVADGSGVSQSGQLHEVGIGDRFGDFAGAVGEGVGVEGEGHDQDRNTDPAERLETVLIGRDELRRPPAPGRVRATCPFGPGLAHSRNEGVVGKPRRREGGQQRHRQPQRREFIASLREEVPALLERLVDLVLTPVGGQQRCAGDVLR